MKTVLILTVGGSHQPILASIEQHRPMKVHFLCSADAAKGIPGSYRQVTGEGKVLKSRPDLDRPDLPCIATLAGLGPESFVVHQVARFDDLNCCYLDAAQMIETARQEHPDTRIVVDYTGGTKSMTAGLTAAALDDGRCEISLVVGRRPDLVKVQDQTEFVRPVPVWDAQMRRRLRAAQELVGRYDYAGAESLLRAAAARFAGDGTLDLVRRGINLCQGFDAWDRFDHAAARRRLEPYRGEFVPLWRFLEYLAGKAGHGFEWVEDLLRNAQRRRLQGRFDDAVGRVYRALEMTAQVWLKQRYGIDTGDVDLARVPEAQRPLLERFRLEDEGKAAKVKVGLLQAWDLIAASPGDPLAPLFGPRRGPVLNFLTVRNQSLFAHGYRPVAAEDYDQHVPRLLEWLEECLEAAVCALGRPRPLRLGQLPTDFLTLNP
jgi:hypothetical protein